MGYAQSQNPLHTFPRNFVHGEVVNRQQVVVMEFGKRHTHDTTDFLHETTCYRLVVYVADLLLRTCWQHNGEVVNLLCTCYGRGNWCNGFWPLGIRIIKF